MIGFLTFDTIAYMSISSNVHLLELCYLSVFVIANFVISTYIFGLDYNFICNSPTLFKIFLIMSFS